MYTYTTNTHIHTYTLVHRTGDTLCDFDEPIVLERMEFPEPVIKIAIEPKSKGDSEKMGMALAKLAQVRAHLHEASVQPVRNNHNTYIYNTHYTALYILSVMQTCFLSSSPLNVRARPV
jgi:hypothetical protein